MIEGAHPVFQSFLGTLLTWGLTAAGAGLVFLPLKGDKRKILDGSLGFAAGVMLAASYWSLLAPAIEIATNQGYGQEGEYTWMPVAFGFALGGLFVHGADALLPSLGAGSGNVVKDVLTSDEGSLSPRSTEFSDTPVKVSSNQHIRRRDKLHSENSGAEMDLVEERDFPADEKRLKAASWRRMLLLIIAITVHNIPEGLAVGVSFGAIGHSSTATFHQSVNLAIGIGIQNFPEGLAVSLPLYAAGFSSVKSFWYGQLSGMVEPLAGVLGAAAVVIAEPLLPYALAFAAGAMIFVVVDDIVPEAQTAGNSRLASWGVIAGFIVMMTLDVALG